MGTAMTVKMGDLTFDHVAYDADGDVLYLHIGPPQAAAGADETPEGHVVRYDAFGRVVGVTVLNARWLLERDGMVTVTLPHPTLRADAHDLAEALGIGA
jgi:YD repeat-containing protein